MPEIVTLLQQMSVFLIIAYLLSKSPAFRVLEGELRLNRQPVLLYLVFTGLAIFGHHIALPADSVVSGSSAIGIVFAGLVAGPQIGLAVGVSAGGYVLLTSDWSLPAAVVLLCALLQGGLGGAVGSWLVRRGKGDRLFSPLVAMLVVAVAVLLQLLLVFALVDGELFALSAPGGLVLPIVLVNVIGAGLFMLMIRDQQVMAEQLGTFFSARALKIAERSLGIFGRGFNAETARELAKIIYDETGVGAVSISDRQHILAFIGTGSDHHLEGLEIASPQTKLAIKENRVIYADGIHEKFLCAFAGDECPLGSALVVPLRVDQQVVGTIKLYEPKNRLFTNLNRTLGEGITQLLSEQMLRYHYEDQKNLLIKSELKLIQAQVNPHFLFNALNTIVAVVRKNPDQARSLLLHLSNYFRKNLKRSSDLATLEEELDHVNSYLVIQRARFGDKLEVIQEVDPQLLTVLMPTFTLQPIVENAVKHGISNMLGGGTVRITANVAGDGVVISVEDNAGTYCSKLESDGLGMNIVDKRIKNYYGSRYGSEIECVPGEKTRVKLYLPLKKDDQ